MIFTMEDVGPGIHDYCGCHYDCIKSSHYLAYHLNSIQKNAKIHYYVIAVLDQFTIIRKTIVNDGMLPI